MNTLKKIFVLLLSVAFISPFVSRASAIEYPGDQYLEQLQEMREILAEDAASPSRLGELREEYEQLRSEIQEWRQEQSERRQALKKKRLMMVRFYQDRLVVDNDDSSLISSTNENSPDEVVSRDSGKASYYADKFNGRTTASGEVFSNAEMTAAHRTLDFGTRVRVTSPSTGKSIEVRINDRGPYVDGRIIDLSAAAFEALDNLSRGVIDVEIEVLAD